jgi:flagellar biosynthesis protein FlhF
MKIKKYIASTIQEGKDRVIRELGDDAIILSTRTVNRPGSGEAAVIEIVAAIDENASPRETVREHSENIPATYEEEISEANNPTPSNGFDLNDRVFDEILELKSSIIELTEYIKYKNLSSFSPEIRSLYKMLLDADLSENLSLNTIIRMNNSPKFKSISPARLAGEILTEKIKFSDSLTKPNEQKIICFFGPTGSGKTTTLVKLAIIAKLILEGQALIICADSVKIGGADQLQAYSSIAGIPYRYAFTNEDLKDAISKEHNADFIFIDTPGAGQFNNSIINEIENLLSGIRLDHKYLTLQSNYSKSALNSCIKMFKRLKPTSIILSKTDEAINYGEMTEALISGNIPISYFSTGQNIPDDIEQAEQDRFISMLLPDTNEE